ncbi:phage integrase family protein [Caballeronia sp. LP006]|uniref:phage integrase family protein n=1 Tax=Caballeronia sp. LP006 TaxID=3038552 RepID=UPI00285AD74A|nr:phage integrase family protein [Caballeronia sp. LP006]MDR5827282.1 phage integrase family protein [Caballeronia sp. LP006]
MITFPQIVEYKGKSSRMATANPASITNPAADTPRFSLTRRLTRQHFALYRGYLDGVSEAKLHASYGDAGTDVRTTRRLIVTLRDTLSVLARRAHDTDAAYLLRLRPGSIPLFEPPQTQDTPSLDEYRERIDPDGVYSEAELLALHEEEYPPGATPALDRRASRNLRLRRRQTDALSRMEASLAQEPRPDHPLDGWFEPAVTARLAAVGLSTVGDVVSLIETRRHRWYTVVPRLGPKGAQRIVDWLQLHANALRHTFSPLALVPRRDWPSDASARGSEWTGSRDETLRIAPLEALRVPAALDGSKGTNRRPSEFGTDLQAIHAWLAARTASAHTQRAYRREAERLLLWAVVEKHKPMSSLDEADCNEYITAFLPNPQPSARWVAKGRVDRCLSSWRPFAGPLSDRSRESARAILSAMGAWLEAQGYLATNPFIAQTRVAEPPVFDAVDRSLDTDQWQIVLQSVSRDVYGFAEHRDRLALLLAYATGMRRGELAAATTEALSVGRLSGVAGPIWRVRVARQRGEPRTVFLPPAVAEALIENLALRGLSDPLACPEGTPILAQTRGGNALGPDGIGKLFKRVFANAAALAEGYVPGSGKRLAQASTHWIRHTHSVHALTHGAALPEVSANLGHSKLSTTKVYLENQDSSKLLGVERLIRRATFAAQGPLSTDSLPVK